MGKLAFEYQFRSPPERVWRGISATDRFNRACGLPAVEYRDEPQNDGTTRRFCSTHKFGMDLDYEELPFHWVHERFFEVVRVYSKGPVKRLKQVSTIRPSRE